MCQASSSAVNESEAIVMITLSSNASLMCVKLFEIHFNEENKTVPVDSPEANFTISIYRGLQPFLEGEIYLLDLENNKTEVPCVFHIPGEFHFNNEPLNKLH